MLEKLISMRRRLRRAVARKLLALAFALDSLNKKLVDLALRLHR